MGLTAQQENEARHEMEAYRGGLIDEETLVVKLAAVGLTEAEARAVAAFVDDPRG